MVGVTRDERVEHAAEEEKAGDVREHCSCDRRSNEGSSRTMRVYVYIGCRKKNLPKRERKQRSEG